MWGKEPHVGRRHQGWALQSHSLGLAWFEDSHVTGTGISQWFTLGPRLPQMSNRGDASLKWRALEQSLGQGKCSINVSCCSYSGHCRDDNQGQVFRTSLGTNQTGILTQKDRQMVECCNVVSNGQNMWLSVCSPVCHLRGGYFRHLGSTSHIRAGLLFLNENIFPSYLEGNKEKPPGTLTSNVGTLCFLLAQTA